MSMTRKGERCVRRGFSRPVDSLWDFDGSCKPGEMYAPHQCTFSVGVFQWKVKASGKGVKRGKTVKRFVGYIGQPEEVYAKAEAFCQQMEAKENAA